MCSWVYGVFMGLCVGEELARLVALRGWGRGVYNGRFWHAWRRRDDVDIVCTTIRPGTRSRLGETPRADVSTWVVGVVFSGGGSGVVGWHVRCCRFAVGGR